jgi:hypothetical protein
MHLNSAVTFSDCLKVVKTLATVVTAFVAWRVLKNWQRQDQAKHVAEFWTRS